RYGCFRDKSDLVLNGVEYGQKRAGLVFQASDDCRDVVLHRGFIVSNAGKKPQEARIGNRRCTDQHLRFPTRLHVGKRLETCRDSRYTATYCDERRNLVISNEPEKKAAPEFRVDVKLRDVLLSSNAQRNSIASALAVEEGLPEPVYPQYTYPRWPTERKFHNYKAWRTWKSLGAPYFKHRLMPGQIQPLISYLFSEWKCNLDCHYCWSYDNSVKGMTEQTAKQSIDWLHGLGNRFLALMGGEPLLRPKFIHKICYYASKKDFIVYLPTNGRLMKPDVIDRLGDAGLGAVNLAVDCIDEKPGLAKALTPIRPYFEYLIKNMKKYCTSVFFNVCICRTNMDDVRTL